MTLADMEDLFYTDLMTALGYDPEKTYGNSSPPVRKSWPTGGAPAWKITDDVLFLKIFDQQGQDISMPIDTVMENDGEDLKSYKGQTRVLRLNLVAYGPHCYDNLLTVRRYYQTAKNADIRAADIYLIPGTDTPQRLPELFSGQWWDRADLDLYFNSLVECDEPVNAIKEVPVTVSKNSQGGTKQDSSDFDVKRSDGT